MHGAPHPRFVTGSLLRHILVMTATGGTGLVAIFLGDLANILFLTQLGDVEVIAAVGYASSILFLTTSMGIGLAIAATTVISPAIGAGDWTRARRLSVNAHILSGVAALALSLTIWLAIPSLLTLLGAAGRTHELAAAYLRILVPALPPLAVGMTAAAVLRSLGDPRRAMNVTLAGALVNVALDPIFIFVLQLGIEGAAMASVLSRCVMMVVGLFGVVRAHKLMDRPDVSSFASDARPILAIAIPAILTNIATPVSNAYVTAAIAPFGDEAVAAWAIIGRVIPVAFGSIFALSASIGPVLGQNLGAKKFDRIKEAITTALFVMAGFTVLAWLLLAIAAGPLVAVFKAKGEAAALIILFCRWLAPLFVFLGALFVANAALNTLGRPQFATLFNWLRATAGTIPLVQAGGYLAGASGVLTGSLLGASIVSFAAIWLSYRQVETLRRRAARLEAPVAAGAPAIL